MKNAIRHGVSEENDGAGGARASVPVAHEAKDVSPATRRSPATGAAGALALAVVRAEHAGGFLVACGGREVVASLDPSVDPALVRSCLSNGARVLLSLEPAPGSTNAEAFVIVGALLTERPVTIDRFGVLRAEAERILLQARSEVLVRSAGSFLRLKGEDVELYGRQIATRAREMCRVLGRLVKIN